MNKNVFNPKDAQSAKNATLFVTIGKRRYAMLNAKDFEAKATVSTADVPRLGCMIMGKKPTGLEIKLSMTVYKCSDMFDDIIESYKETGILPVFDCQVTSEDGTTNIGKSTKVYKDCIIDGEVLLSMFDAAGEFIEQSIEAYAMDYSTSDKYTEPSYM
ncbi:MAG: phage tail tube protein [Lachnospiraceae bacterium]|nr:phage tail tube protein [Lachnospiraceae bacterium]